MTEAQISRLAADTVWNYAFEVQQNVDSGARDKPTLEGLIGELPVR